MKKDIEEKLT